MQQAVLFSTTQTADQLKARISGIAEEQRLKLDPETFSVVYEGMAAVITASYADDVALVPGGPKYKWRHDLDVNMRRMAY